MQHFDAKNKVTVTTEKIPVYFIIIIIIIMYICLSRILRVIRG